MVSAASAKQRAIFATSTLLLLLVLGELLTGWVLGRAEARLPFPEPELYVSEPIPLERLAKRFDADLGWVHRYESPYGERPRPVDYGRPLVAAFGDSFTRGDEVKHAETWSSALAELLGGDVYNFGVGGYGMDQILLRFERDQPRRPTPIALFAFIGGDLERCYRRYWKFHHPAGRFPMIKPRLLLENGELQLLPNPVGSTEELLAAIQDLDFVTRLAAEDPSFNPHGLPKIRRPYLSMLVRPSLWRGLLAAQRTPDAWASDEGTRLAEQILVRFDQVARARGTLPVVLQLPVLHELRNYHQQSAEPLVTRRTREICQRQNLHCLFPISSGSGQSLEQIGSYFVDGLKGGHYSPAGNGWIARAIAGGLRSIAPELLSEPASNPGKREP